MEKEDTKVLIHAGLAFVVIIGGFFLMEFYGGPFITAGIINSEQSIDCGDVGTNNCCELLEQADKCELISENNADYLCYSGNTKIYFSSDTYEYCS